MNNNEVRLAQRPFIIIHIISVIIAAIAMFSGDLNILQAPLAALLFSFMFRIAYMISRYIPLIWIISIPLSFFISVWATVELFQITGISPVSGYPFLILVGVLSVYYFYSDWKRFLTDDYFCVNAKIQKALLVLSVALAAVTAVACIYFAMTGKYAERAAQKEDEELAKKEAALYVAPDPMEASYFGADSAVLAEICTESLEASKAEEKDDTKGSWSITKHSTIEGAFYLEAINPGELHKDYGKGLEIKNAVMIVTHYQKTLNSGGTFPRERWMVWVYPDFVKNNTVLSYDTDNVHSNSLGKESIEEIKEWLVEEYDDMIIMELELPDIDQ